MADVERLVVIKEMLDYFDVTNPDEVAKAQERFKKEAGILVTLKHPNIPDIYDYFIDGNRHLIVMKYIEGDSLEKRITHWDDSGQKIPGHSCPINEVLQWGIQLCKVLEYLASKSVIHHDIKPANVILDKNSGNVYLVDFGTAKAQLIRQPGGTIGRGKSSIWGTEGYAPPEQYDWGPNKPPQTEPRSDVYALAAMLCHLLTDDHPAKHPFQFPNLSTLSPDLEKVLRRAFLDVSKRPHATDLRQELEALFAALSRSFQIHFCTHVGTVTVTDLQSLIAPFDECWNDGKRHLFDKDLEGWLWRLQQDALVKEAETFRQQYAKKDEDRGLELFLEEVEQKHSVTRSQRPKAQVHPDRIDWGERHEDDTCAITIQNIGKGFFFGTVQTSATWLKLNCTEFEGNKAHSIEATTDLSKLRLGHPQQASLSFNTTGGQINLPVQITRVNAQVYLERGVAYYNAGQLDAALQNYQEALRRDPTDVERAEAVAAITVIYSDLNRWNECVPWATKEHPAIKWVDERELRWPNARGNVARFCKAWADQLNRQTSRGDVTGILEVRTWYEKAQERWPGIVDPATLAQVYVDLAMAYCDQSKFDEAFSEWQKAARIAPQVANSPGLAQRFVDLAQSLASRSQFSAAVQRYQQAQMISIVTAPNSGLALIYFEWAKDDYRKDDFNAAVQHGEKALALDPANVPVAREVEVWRNYAERRKRVEVYGLIGLFIAGLSALWGLLLAFLLHSFTPLAIVSVILDILSASAVLTFTLAFVVRRAAKRLLDVDYGGLPFIAGLSVSILMWVVPAIALGASAGIIISRLTLFSVDGRWLWLIGWITLTAFVSFALITAQQVVQKMDTALRLFLWGLAGLGIGVVAGTTIGLLSNFQVLYPRALEMGMSPFASFWNSLGGSWQWAVVIVIGIIAVIIGNTVKDGWTYVIGGAIALAIALTFIVLIPLPIVTAFFSGMVPEATWYIGLLGVCVALGWGAQRELALQKVDTMPRLGVLAGVGTLGVFLGLLLYMLYRGSSGFVIGVVFGCLVVGAGAFAESYLSGQGHPQATKWQWLTSTGRVGALVGLMLFTSAAVLWEATIERTVWRVWLYEQGRAAYVAKQTAVARVYLRQLVSEDPNFADAANLLKELREVDLETSRKILDSDEAMSGEIRTYQIILTNRGPDTATGVVITDVIPSQLKLLPESLPPSVIRTQSKEGDTISWSGTVGAGQSITLPLKVQLLPATMLPVITNSVQVNNGLGVVVTRQAILRIVPTRTPAPTSTPTLTPTPTVMPTPTATPTPGPEPMKLATGSDDWASSQGVRGWWYVDGPNGNWGDQSNMQWDPSLRSQYPDDCPGGCWRSNFNRDFARLNRYGGHPGKDHYVGKRWVSPITGWVRVIITAYKIDRGGNGVTLRFMQDGEVLETIGLDGNQGIGRLVRWVSDDISITAGSWLMLALESNGNTDHDLTAFDMMILRLP
jgi:uncharacterized repeat protein (TIGR01451 family)